MNPEAHVTITPYASKIEERLVFFFVSVGVFALTYGFFFVIDFLPEKPESETPAVVSVTSEADFEAETSPLPAVEAIDPYPLRIIFEALDSRTVTVLNPESSNIAALDAALLEGVVRHPDSADFERTGTIFLFGHSSYLPSVRNKNFQAFNGIQDLGWGDIIRLQSSDTEYVYRVDRVYEVSANDAEVAIEAGKAQLTLVTCDSFGATSDRFIVEASLIRSDRLEMGENEPNS